MDTDWQISFKGIIMLQVEPEQMNYWFTIVYYAMKDGSLKHLSGIEGDTLL